MWAAPRCLDLYDRLRLDCYDPLSPFDPQKGASGTVRDAPPVCGQDERDSRSLELCRCHDRIPEEKQKPWTVNHNQVQDCELHQKVTDIILIY